MSTATRYAIAIPSYKRAELLEQTTLEYLIASNVDMRRLSIFVSNEAERDEYKRRFGAKLVRWDGRDLTNVTEKFNAIHFAYEPGTQVFVMEDDIEGLVMGGPGADGKPSNAKKDALELDQIVRMGFERIANGGIWGIAPHSNGYFFTGKVSNTLRLVVAHAFGFIATRDPDLAVSQIAKSDYERTCRYFIKYGETWRLDMVGVKTDSYTQAGGMQADLAREQRLKAETESCAYLVRRYPHLLKLNTKKKSLFPELSFLRCSRPAHELQQVQEIHDRAIGEL